MEYSIRVGDIDIFFKRDDDGALTEQAQHSIQQQIQQQLAQATQHTGSNTDLPLDDTGGFNLVIDQPHLQLQPQSSFHQLSLPHEQDMGMLNEAELATMGAEIKRKRPPSKPANCPQCHKVFSKRENLNRHVKEIHLEQRPFPCSECGKRFKQKQQADQHIIAVHLGEHLHMCPLCPKKFSQKTHLNRHLESEIHAPKEEHYCLLCEKTLHCTASNFQRHFTIYHSDKRKDEPTEFPCDQCDKVYKTLRYLRLHQTTHQPEHSKHPCDKCGKLFNAREYKVKHQRYCGLKRYKRRETSENKDKLDLPKHTKMKKVKRDDKGDVTEFNEEVEVKWFSPAEILKLPEGAAILKKLNRNKPAAAKRKQRKLTNYEQGRQKNSKVRKLDKVERACKSVLDHIVRSVSHPDVCYQFQQLESKDSINIKAVDNHFRLIPVYGRDNSIEFEEVIQANKNVVQPKDEVFQAEEDVIQGEELDFEADDEEVYDRSDKDSTEEVRLEQSVMVEESVMGAIAKTIAENNVLGIEFNGATKEIELFVVDKTQSAQQMDDL